MQTKKLRKYFFSMMNIKEKPIEETFKALQNSTSKTELKLHSALSNFYDEIKYFKQFGCFPFEQDRF